MYKPSKRSLRKSLISFSSVAGARDRSVSKLSFPDFFIASLPVCWRCGEDAPPSLLRTTPMLGRCFTVTALLDQGRCRRQQELRRLACLRDLLEGVGELDQRRLAGGTAGGS